MTSGPSGAGEAARSLVFTERLLYRRGPSAPGEVSSVPAIDIARFRRVLEEEKASVVHQLRELGATESGDLTERVQFGDGFADAGAATAERTETLGLIDALKVQLDGVEAALARIDEGTYGTCARCGKEIPVARLEARPESILCVECKSKA